MFPWETFQEVMQNTGSLATLSGRSTRSESTVGPLGSKSPKSLSMRSMLMDSSHNRNNQRLTDMSELRASDQLQRPMSQHVGKHTRLDSPFQAAGDQRRRSNSLSVPQKSGSFDDRGPRGDTLSPRAAQGGWMEVKDAKRNSSSYASSYAASLERLRKVCWCLATCPRRPPDWHAHMLLPQ